MKLSLNRDQLKIIAIISMVIDHFAWGFVEFYSPLGQFLHVCGRFTIPIMTFFVAEGFRKTSNIKAYISRLATYAIISIIPFYIFFHEEYGYRQNFFFDLLFGLLTLTVLESTLKKTYKILLTVLLFLISAIFGGWPISSILFVLAFYYGKDFKQKAKWATLIVLTTVAVLVVLICLNQIYHFSSYEWVWWDKFYQLGILLALPLLACYNGDRGNDIGGRYFFYLFYPIHFVVLFALKVVLGADTYVIYLMLHLLALLITCTMLALTMHCRPSKGQTAIVFFLACGNIYILGFILEILSATVGGYHLAILVEYFGEMLVAIGIVYFTSLLCKKNVPYWIYTSQMVFGIWVMYALLTTRINHFFYQSIDVNMDGPFPRLELTYGPGFFITISYLGIISVGSVILCTSMLKKSTELERKRLSYIIVGYFFIWLPYLLKLAGLTGGYEIPGVGIALTSVCFYLVLMRYGFLDSITIAGNNVLDHGQEGIIVVNTDYQLQYFNPKSLEIFPDLSLTQDLSSHKILRDVIFNDTQSIELKNCVYEFRIDPLVEGTYTQGYMIWIIDSTEHFQTVARIQELATHDTLTGLFNRSYFQEILTELLTDHTKGTFLMMDLDNFKQVNDHFGHQIGDSILIALGNVLQSYKPQIADTKFIASRLGGDEFTAYLLGDLEEAQVLQCLQELVANFKAELHNIHYPNQTSLSIGAITYDGDSDLSITFSALYSRADEALYEVKQNGKDQIIIRSFTKQ